MKLRLRSIESKETLRIEVPTPCSFHQFKQTLCLQISSSSLPSSSLHLSLNRKDELQASSPEDSLQSLGITSGDLIFYTLDPNAFRPLTLTQPQQTLAPNRPSQEETLTLPRPVQQQKRFSEPGLSQLDMGDVNIDESQTLGSNAYVEQQIPIHVPSEQHTQLKDSDMGENDTLVQAPPVGFDMVETNLAESETLTQKEETLNSVTQKEETIGSDIQKMETQDANNQDEEAWRIMDVDDGSELVVGKKFSVPCFLRKVLRDELGEDGSEHRLLVIAVHAVMLESGFVAFDSVSGVVVDRFHLPDEWPSTAFTMSLWYTLPELINSCSEAIEAVVLKFQSLGHYINVYGSLAKNGSGLYRVPLNEYRFAQTIDVVWAKCDSTGGMGETDKNSYSNSYPENEVFEFWKIVKDGLALPLLIDLCERGDLMPPPCLMRLPTELKLNILELLPGADVAKVGCVCRELQYLSTNNDLWKQKFVEEFGNEAGKGGGGNWQGKFVSYWENRKKRKRDSDLWRRYPHVNRPFMYPRSDPNPFGRFPGMIGGDFDRFPGLGVPGPFGPAPPGLPFTRHAARRNFTANCHLGGRT